MRHKKIRLLGVVLLSSQLWMNSVFSSSSTGINSANWWKPKPGLSWQIILSGQRDLSLQVDVYDVDLFEVTTKEIEALHQRGKKVICYFSAGSYEDWRTDKKNFAPSIIGKKMDDWPGEKWLDVSQLDLIMPVMNRRMKLAVQKGCDAVDPDNMDGYSQDSGFKISYQDQITFNKAIASNAHELGLAVGLKNDLEQIKDLLNDYDFAVNEECFQFKECDNLLPFIKAGKPVYGIEYELETKDFCEQAKAMGFDTLKKKLSLDNDREPCL